MRSFFVLAGLALVALIAGTGPSLGAAGGGPSLLSIPGAVGAPVIGQRLTGEPGTWSGSGTLTYGYQWHRCDATGANCGSISGATAPSYKLVAKDVGQTIGLTVTATDSGGTTSAYGNLVGPIAAASAPLISTVQPTISGTASQGQSVQVSDGAWSPKPTQVSYAWQRCDQNGRSCTPISNATTNSYTVGADDAGHALLVLVTATSGATSEVTLSTAAFVSATTTTTTTAAGNGPTETAAPAVTGTAAAGDRLELLSK